MQKRYDEARITEETKISDKMILVRLVNTVFIVVSCLIAMAFSAYAYFTSDVTSGTNVIQAANFKINLEITIVESGDAQTEAATEAKAITPVTTDYKLFKTDELEAGKTYKITIKPTEDSTATTGFVIITATGCEQTYHTQQLGVDEKVNGGETKEITFTLKITDATDVVFQTHWGTSSSYSAFSQRGANEELYITDTEDVTINIKGTTNGLPSSQGEAQTESDTDSVQQNDTQSKDANSTETEDAGQ